MQNDVRIFFTKTGTAKYISHLDLMRCMSRAFRRAKIPLWFTEGYNPHLFMTFARPLSLGQESLCECVDVRLTGDMTFKEIRTRLNEALVPGITVVSVAKPVHKPTEIAFADYEIRLFSEAPEKVLQALRAGAAGATIPVVKKAKQGRRKIDKEIDIKPNVISFSAECTASGVLLLLRLTAGDQNNINPALLLSALLGETAALVEHTEILKKRVLLENGEAFA